ncbi:MAG: cation-translocating P-type ATPase [Oscillospiraceae bacterium]|nr:cation-translocating P-type ATPase [Oscillospiraceae bacterium]
MQGLTDAEVRKRQLEYGENSLAEQPRAHPLRMLLSQFRDIMVLILLAAAGISWLLGAYADAGTIAVIVILNALLGFVQEYRTEQTLLALRSMAAPAARVRRNGSTVTIPASELVPDDIVLLEAGDCVPADAMILNCAQLFTEESILTGESAAAEKHTHTDRDGEPRSEINRPDLLYAGTSVIRGTAEARVIATGKSTQMGKISQMLSDIEHAQTPLQKRLAELGRTVAIICLVICGLVFAAGVLRGEPVFGMLMTGITIAIAAIPEGLPATVTIALAIAVRRMLSRNALVNQLHAVETLGCASVICTDKTGTITENKMTVRQIRSPDALFHVTGSGWQKSGSLTENGIPCPQHKLTPLTGLLRCAVLCNHAAISAGADNEWRISGDPMEAALLIAAAKCRVTAESFSRCRMRSEIPFDSETRFMSVTYDTPDGTLTVQKGSVDVMLSRCTHYRSGGQDFPMTAQKRAVFSSDADSMAADALRVLAFAEQSAAAPGRTVYLGLMGMIDPPREQAKQAIADCTRAGIRVVMLTGDHIRTASAIAKQAGIPHAEYAMTGAELDRIPDGKLPEILNKYAVFARVTPAHKLRLVRAFRKMGMIAAMTGDGVNDAPAVKEADIGVAMGKNGTDVTRQAADIVLLDDRFDTLAAAVRQGRTVYANIRKFVRYLLACNIGEVLTMFLGILMGLPMVLLPTQILLVNLMTDGLPAVALGMEPPADDIMQHPPRAANASFFAGGLLSRIVFRGIFIALSTLGAFTTVLRMSCSAEHARTAALVTLICSQLLHVFECKREDGTLFSVPYFSNGKLLIAAAISAAVTAAALLVPALQHIFSTVSLPLPELLTSLAFTLAVPLCASLAAGRQKPHEAVRITPQMHLER